MKNPKNIILLAVALILVSGTGFAVVKNQKKITAPLTKEESNKDEQTNMPKTNEKGDNAPQESTQPVSTNQPTPTMNTAVRELADVTLTVYMINDPITSQDGKTTVPAGSLTPYFYLPSGLYSVQKLSGSNWADVATSINYPGHGGLSVTYAFPAEDNISYRVLKIEAGKVTAVSKTFVVKRADITGGVKTYN